MSSAVELAKAASARADGRPASKADRTRARILEAAARVVSERGYQGTTLAQIAAVADLRTGSLYYHFRSKDDLVTELLRVTIEQTFAHTRAAVEAALPDSSAIELLRVAVRAHLDAVQGVTNAYSVAYPRVLAQVPPEIRAAQYRVEREYGRFWAQLFDEAEAGGAIRDGINPLAARLLVVGALNWTVDWPPGAVVGSRDLRRTVEMLFFDGLHDPGSH